MLANPEAQGDLGRAWNSKGSSVAGLINSLIDNLLKAEPGHIPAAITFRITAYPHLRVRHDVSTERVVPRESSQFREELVAADIVAPCLRHWTLERHSITLITCCCYPLNSHEFGKSIDGV